ncbi:MAG TPA: response regulator [Rectinemataceae bacterium]|nr:response regulator [Rectinemataceae bacterium]
MATPETLWRAAFVESSLPLVALDWRGVFALWNDSFAAFFRDIAGSEPERFQGSFYELVKERGGLRLDYFAAELFLRAKNRISVETPFLDAKGNRRWIEARMSVIEPGGTEAANANRFLLCNLDDVTDRVAKERQLVEAKEEAEQATRTKSLFLANMSHEIRTPIQTILGVVELLGETGLDGEQADYAAQIGFSADVLLALINDILDFSKIEAGKLNLEAADFDLPGLIGQSVDLLALDAHRKGLELVMDLGEGVPALLRGDATRLRQILINLLKNAIKFTSEGFVGLFVGKISDEAGERLRFEVRDSGIGIPEELRQRLFTPFYQADMSAARRAGGTGLGLAISRHLVELMEGSIGVLPREPEGSVFWFEIPLTLPEFAEDAPLPLLDLEERRLLVVDDSEEARSIALRLAARGGWDAVGVASGAEALEALREAVAAARPFEACLVDQAMPKMDGWRLASEIRDDPGLAEVRLILMVPAGTMGRDSKMKLLSWFSAYIPKPIKPTSLIDALESGGRTGESEGTSSRDRETGRPRSEGFEAEVLIAEDHEVNRELFGIILGKLGLRVDEARDGMEAVEKATRRAAEGRPHDLILMDIFMPRLDGYEASRELRKKAWAGPIIAVTASALKGEREKCIEAGMDDVLLKPFRKADLETILATWLPASKGGRAPEREMLPTAPAQKAKASRPAEPMDGAAQPAKPMAGRASFAMPAAEAPPRAEPSDYGAIDPEVFDFEHALETFLGQEGTVRSLLGRFEAKVGSQLAELSAALERRDFESFRETAHSIKGAAWNLSARQLGDAARDAETAGRQGDDQGAVMALTALGAAFGAFARALRDLERRRSP